MQKAEGLLTTLHVALNNYGADEDHLDGAGDTFDININIPVFHRLRTLYYSENNISSWWTVCRLGRHFPSLEHLVLLGNPLAHIPAPLPSKESLGARGGRVVEKLPEPTRLSPTPPGHKTAHRLFASLHTLGLSETLLERWESIDALGEWMPKLANLRLGNVLPVFQLLKSVTGQSIVPNDSEKNKDNVVPRHGWDKNALKVEFLLYVSSEYGEQTGGTSRSRRIITLLLRGLSSGGVRAHGS
ncbi:tubulin-specific chaperone cofactor E-like protein [Clonorchis sinensis]|uniref:Tubulin-specific chaperone cofactor E-like protein n=1 Tax=Clonorchis sinensis TaxID=79923 RepID=G7YIX6_CLOSI|nr:tubulin-specific chaperone cofactor E-like protein [Clonorchis sinensis]